MSEHSTVSVDEIAKRLHFTRNHVYKAILPHVGHEKTGNRIQVDEADLRQWLMRNASFTRQTKFMDDYDEPAVNEYIAMLKSYGLATVCPPPAQRSKLPFQNVRPFDFWDKELIFPDDPRFNNAESFYRAMYESAAIKIKLGERKTIFCAPALEAVLENKQIDIRWMVANDNLPDGAEPIHFNRPDYTDINSITGKKELFIMSECVGLYPAIGAEQEEEYYRKMEENRPPVVIRIEGQKDCVEQVRKTLAASGIYTYGKDIEEMCSASGSTLRLKIPQASIDYWSEKMTKMKKISQKYEELYEQEMIFGHAEEE